MNETKHTISLYDFLKPILATGTEEDIARARKNYWNSYKAAWRKKRRKEQKEFTVSFTQKELHILKPAAKKHKRSNTKFIKEAALAYCQSLYLPPDSMAINHIRELLALNYNALQQLAEENILIGGIGNELMQKIAVLESQVVTSLHNPKTLEQWIRDTVNDNPDYRMKLTGLLKTECK